MMCISPKHDQITTIEPHLRKERENLMNNIQREHDKLLDKIEDLFKKYAK